MDSRLLEVVSERVLVLDGAMGTSVHGYDLPLSDYENHENCTDVLSLTRPDVVRDIHRSFLSVGCDVVLTNTFGANRLVLGDFGIADRAREMNRSAARIAREACEEFCRPGQPRFVLGSMGPGTRLPSLGQTTWDTLLDSYFEQACALLEGGVDGLLIETCQDILQSKVAVVASTDAMSRVGREVPLFCTVTIETTGTLLVGTEIAAAVTSLQAFRQVTGLGLNCATGPQEMSEYVRYLGSHTDRLLVVQPNAGLPQLVDGKPHYALTPKELARWLREFVEVDGVNMVGGCCGTTPRHLAAVVDAVGGRTPVARTCRVEPAVSSLYQAVTLHQDNAFLSIGERTNANGSKKFRQLLAEGDIDGMVQMARTQVKHGSHCLDVCTAYVGRDERADMTAVVKRFVTDVTVPLVIDSTEAEVIETALKLTGGKCIINSINLESGEGPAGRVCALAKRYGAALIALTIDEEGMAKTADRKLAVARRIYDLAVSKYGLSAGDLIFDPLTFTICTGNEADRRLGVETLRGLRLIKEALPGVYTLLGVSNISFGVSPPIRKVLNSVFLHYARASDLDSAILHVAGIVPLFKIDDRQRCLAEDLIFDRRKDGYDPLHELLTVMADASSGSTAARERPKDVRERLKNRIVDGDRTGLEEDLEEAMTTYRPLDIINDILLDGMKTVGDLFGAGQMQLPFVLQSAETMKTAVRFLEPHMDRSDGEARGTIVLATVRGDVHDIGKNLVDIILTNNGYKVVNLGIKQPIASIVDAYDKHGADAIGMSGLLVKSTVVMRENLEVLNERGLCPPVILGGAALTRRYVEDDLRDIYHGPVCYAKDAFEGLHLMKAVMTDQFAASASKSRAGRTVVSASATGATTEARPEPVEDGRADDGGGDDVSSRPEIRSPVSNVSRQEPVPEPPFWGSRVVEHMDLRAPLAYINENMLFQVQWGYRKNRRAPEEFAKYVNENVRPVLRDLVARCERENILVPQAVYGFWPCQADGDSLLVYNPDDRDRAVVRFDFPRQRKAPYWCLSDFFRPVGDDVMDIVAFMAVTAGRRASEVARTYFEEDRYQDYLHLHGLSVELAEALAEYIHKQIRVEWGIAADDARDKQALFKQHYRGSRYSFGYPACPRLEDQLKIWPLLQPERIGVTLTEEFQLEPEQTTTAIITHHRQAKYFNVL